MKSFSRLISVLVFLPLLAHSKEIKEIPNASEEFVKSCAQSADCELRFFYELSKTYRPSNEEAELAQYVLQVKDTAEKSVWGQRLETFKDAAGNILIRIPATGRFQNTHSNYFSLQSHMDMVLAYADAKPGEDLRPYFKNGVEVELKDGWLRAKDNKTSLGADNGIGVAFELRLLVDSAVDHPPLELIFTTAEEIGLVGAFASDLPILSKKMLCLDGMTPEPGYIIAGAQGGQAYEVKSEVGYEQMPATESDVVVQVRVTRLAGGHSGNDIHRGRLNGIKAFANLVKFLSAQVGEVKVKTLVAGDIGIFNKIPNIFQAELAVSKSKLTRDTRYQIESYMRSMIQQNADDALKGEVEVAILDGNDEKYLTTSWDFTKGLIEAILAAPNGVIDTDPRYVNNILTSSNLSFMKIDPTQGGRFDFGYLTRGFSMERIKAVTNGLNQEFTNSLLFPKATTALTMDIPPWLEPETSGLLNETLTQSGYFSKKYYLNGGLEPSAFKTKIKDLEVVALGPYNQFAHSVNEHLRLDSIQPTAVGIQKIIQNQK